MNSIRFFLVAVFAWLLTVWSYADTLQSSVRDATTGAAAVQRSTENSGVHTPHINVDPRAVSNADAHAPASNTAAVVTYAAGGATARHVITGIAWSYSANPTGGNLKIEDGSGTTVFTMDITSAGAGFIPFPAPKRGTANTAMIVTLAAGGSGVTGKVSVLNHWTE